MTFLKNRLLLVIFAVVIMFLIAGAYIFGILCFGKNCINTNNKTTALQVNKLIANPETKAMVDNLGINDPKYASKSSVNFQLRLINTSDAQIENVVVKDIFPRFIDFEKGSGNFDSKTKTLTLNTSLKPKEVRVFNFSGRVSNNLSFPQDVLCITNQVNATARRVSTSDSLSFCLDKKIAAKGSSSSLLATSPATGPQSLTLFFLIPVGILGWSLRKYTLAD